MSVTHSRSFREIQICNLQNGAILTFWLKLFVQKSSLHRDVCTKHVKDWEEIRYISLESSKSSFRKIQYRFNPFVSQNTVSREVCIKARSTPASLAVIGYAR